MSDFQTKEDAADVAMLMSQQHDVAATIVEENVVPAVLEEPVKGPTPDIAPEIDHKPDPSALAAWMDDLSEYADKHRGEEKAAKLLDKIASGELDDLHQVNREHFKDDIDAVDEQKGYTPNWIADSALEGAAVDVHDPNSAANDVVPKPAAVDPLGFNGGDGGGGGGGGGWPGGGLPEEASSADPAEPPPAADKPDKPKGAVGKLVDKVLRREDKPDKPKK
jgi:hypothetical protein